MAGRAAVGVAFGERTMNARIGTGRAGRGWRLGRGLALAAVLMGLVVEIPGAQAQRRGGFGGRMRGVQMSRPARMGPGRAARQNRGARNGNARLGRNGRASRSQNPAQNGNFGNRAGERPYAAMRPGVNPGYGARPGQEHLPEWLAQHHNLQQQEDMLRREPGFNRLTPDQQQRVMNRLRTLDSRPEQERQRTLERNEMFERLNPEQKQDVRAAAEAMRQMPPDRHAMMSRAFNDLRRIPPDQRQEILNSARFTHTFSPQERHVLSNLLSIEPYQ